MKQLVMVPAVVRKLRETDACAQPLFPFLFSTGSQAMGTVLPLIGEASPPSCPLTSPQSTLAHAHLFNPLIYPKQSLNF